MTKTRNRTLLSNNHTKPRESHSQKATTQKTRSPATVRYGTAAAVVQLHRMQSTYAACAGAALSHKEKTLRKRTTQPKSLPPKTRRKPPEDPRANRGGRIQDGDLVFSLYIFIRYFALGISHGTRSRFPRTRSIPLFFSI